MNLFYILIGSFLSLSVYHFMVYWGRKNDKLNLYYSLLVLSFAIFIASKGIFANFLINDPRYNIPIYEISRIVSSILNVSITLLFINYALSLKSILKYTKMYVLFSSVITIVGLILAIVQIVNIVTISKILIICTVPIGTFLWFFMLLMFFKNNSKLEVPKWRYYIGFSSIFYALTYTLFPIFMIMGFSGTFQVAIVSIGCLVLAITSAYSLTSQFNQEHFELKETKGNLEAKVIERTNALETANNQKTTVFINLAHEIKTPLTIMNICLDNYIEKVGINKDLEEIKYEIDTLLKNTVNFLDAEKLQRGQIFYDHDNILDLSQMLNCKLPAFEKMAKINRISLHNNIKSNVLIKADSCAIDRVINNLLYNAIRYNSKSGTVNVSLNANTGKCLLIVSDTGIGISEEHQKNIFKPYYQASHEKRNLQGIGMGLYITSEIIHSLSGTISVVSSLSNGSTFTVELPVADLSKKDAEIDLNPSWSNPIDQPEYCIVTDVLDSKCHYTILLVEDNLSLLKILRDRFSTQYNVICASNGREGFEKCITSVIKPDVIISDIMMDEMDGYEFLVKIRSYDAFKNIPFIFLTAKTTEIENVTGLELGAIDYIYKPFSMTILSAKVSTILEFLALKNKLFESERFRTIGMLAASISHEIMNPLSGIKGPLFIIERNAIEAGINDDVFFEGINHIKNNVNRIDNIVITMRSLFHGRSYSFGNLNLLSIVTPIIDIFSDKNKDRIKFKVIIPKDITIISNQGAFTQIIMNLISNAVESINGPGEVIIESQQSDFKCLKIRDSGCGISNEIMNKIFDVAFTTKRENGGTGLGLYIVKELSNRLNITVLIESEMKIGTTVILQFNDSSLESHILVNYPRC